MELKINIHLEPRTKKNSQEIIFRGGRPILVPSKQYTHYYEQCSKKFEALPKMLDGVPLPLSGRYNVKAVYYVATKRRVDISNLHNALHDVLVGCGVLVDDDCMHIGSTDGSCVLYDKDSPRTEITITECAYPVPWSYTFKELERRAESKQKREATLKYGNKTIRIDSEGQRAQVVHPDTGNRKGGKRVREGRNKGA